MFLTDYMKAMFGFKGPSAFVQGKALSDIVGMLNRAVWLFASSLIVLRVEIQVSETLTWWELLAVDLTRYALGFVLPLLLLCQIVPIALQNIGQSSLSSGRQIVYKILFTLAMVGMTLAASVTAGIVAESFNEQERKSVEKEMQTRDALQAQLDALSNLQQATKILLERQQ